MGLSENMPMSMTPVAMKRRAIWALWVLEAQVENDPLLLHAAGVVPDAAVHDGVEVGVLVDAVDEPEVGVVGAQSAQALLKSGIATDASVLQP